MTCVDLLRNNKPIALWMLCLSLRQHYLGQVHWVSRLREISGVSHPKAFDFSINVRLYFNINKLARVHC